MSNVYTIDNIAPHTTKILNEMSKLVVKIKKDPQNKSYQEKYTFRLQKLHNSKHLSKIYLTISNSSEGEKLEILNDLYAQLCSIIQNTTPKEARIPYYGLVNKLYSVANFQVLHKEGNESSWKSIRDNYKVLLDYSIPKG